MNKKVKYASRIFILLILGFISAELIVRLVFGLGNPPIFERSDEYGYRLIPSQNIRRFGNRVFYNAQGLRSEPIAEEPQADTVRILCIGDSITYGGTTIDQEETYPYQLENILDSKGSSRFEVLNASAPSWSIGDEESYMSKHGIYNSHIVVLQISKDDLFQERCSKDLVGNSPNYPDEKPVLALQEIFVKYLPGFLCSPKADDFFKEKSVRQENQLKYNLLSLVRIKNYVSAMDSKLIVVFIGSRMKEAYDVSFVEAGKRQLFDIISISDIDFINLDEKFSSSEGDRLLRDKMHPGVEGNKVIAEALAEHIVIVREE
ncbi:MAG: hypothetical protein JW800_03990 [Candidatus Omnitrophica bacterium]|nr:hypothetical protein [Candidatus Omnitrophota bacterium]